MEQYNLPLLEPLPIDVIPFQNNATGLYTSSSGGTQSTWSGSLAPGNYDSLILHAETPSKKIELSGSITFDTDIVGIIFQETTLGETDLLLGTGTTVYAGAGEARGYELNGAKNWFSFSPDRHTFAFQTVAKNDIHELRILIDRPPLTAVPLPASVWLLGSALGLLVWIKRRESTGNLASH